jgi:phosphoribosylamine-glycine ligase
MKFLVFSEHGEIADLASYLLHVEGHDVLLHIANQNCEQIADEIVPKLKQWWRAVGEDRVWVFDSCSFGDLQDWLREQGEAVVGGCSAADQLENDRQLGQEWFKEAGFDQVWSKNFKDIDEAIEFIESKMAENIQS